MLCRAHHCMSCVVQGPWLHERCRFCLNDKKILSQEAHDLWKRPMGFSFFFHGLGSSLITTVGSELPENITFQGKRQKKSAMGRSVPKRWAQVDFTGNGTPLLPPAQGEAQRNSGGKDRGQQSSCGRVWTKQDEKSVRRQFALAEIGWCGVASPESHA